MLNITKENCSGCCACYNKCPQSCINMVSDEEGFWYPEINQEKCVSCGLCEKVCPCLKVKKDTLNKPMAFAAYAKDENIHLNSSSGGIFSLVANNILKNKGVVFGAKFLDQYSVGHVPIEDIAKLTFLQNSKYVQSHIGKSYQLAKDFLEEQRFVLFTGTPCQIEGLKGYLGKEYENLVTMDLICHGVPSPAVWKRYIQSMENKYNDTVKCVDFRNKKYGWERYSLKIEFENGNEYILPLYIDLYLRGFLKNLYLRPSCSNCKFKSVGRKSDFTIADFWGIKEQHMEMCDNKGVSLVLIHSLKGRNIWNSIQYHIYSKQIDCINAINSNLSAIKSSVSDPNRTQFFDDFSSKKQPIDKIIHKYTKLSWKNKIIKILCKFNIYYLVVKNRS